MQRLGKVCFLLDPTPFRLDPYPVAHGNAELFCQCRVDVHVGLVLEQAQFLDLEVLGMVEGHKTASGGEHEGELPGKVRIVDFVLRRRHVRRHGGIAEFLQRA